MHKPGHSIGVDAKHDPTSMLHSHEQGMCILSWSPQPDISQPSQHILISRLQTFVTSASGCPSIRAYRLSSGLVYRQASRVPVQQDPASFLSKMQHRVRTPLRISCGKQNRGWAGIPMTWPNIARAMISRSSMKVSRKLKSRLSCAVHQHQACDIGGVDGRCTARHHHLVQPTQRAHWIPDSGGHIAEARELMLLTQDYEGFPPGAISPAGTMILSESTRPPDS